MFFLLLKYLTKPPDTRARQVLQDAPSQEITFKNNSSFSGVAIIEYARDKLFITDDNYALVVDEYILFLKQQNLFLNPYTQTEISENDFLKLLKIPQIKSANEILIAQQIHCAKYISKTTIDQLAKLAKGLLNKHDIVTENNSVPVAEKAYQEFHSYYTRLSDIERESLNNYWIGNWTGTFVLAGFVSGMRAMTFGSLYESFDSSCVHSVAGSIIKLIKQLNPGYSLGFDNPIAYSISYSIGRSNFFESKAYLARHDENPNKQATFINQAKNIFQRCIRN